jgi:hypothetical protein
MKRTPMLFACTALAFCSQLATGQFTSATGNLEIYTTKTASSQFGLLNTTLVFPAYNDIPYQEFRQQGVVFTHTYNLGSFDPIVFDVSDQLVFDFEGSMRFGFGIGNASLPVLQAPFPTRTVKYYVGVVDPFSLDVGPSYTHMFRNGTGVTGKVEITIINIGATGAMMQNGTLKGNGILVANVLPVQISSSVFFDFGRSGLGLTFMFNSSNLLAYVTAPQALYSADNRGVVSTSLIKAYAWQILYVY